MVLCENCKIWYLIFRTVFEDAEHCGSKIVARSAPWIAPGFRRDGSPSGGARRQNAAAIGPDVGLASSIGGSSVLARL